MKPFWMMTAKIFWLGFQRGMILPWYWLLTPLAKVHTILSNAELRLDNEAYDLRMTRANWLVGIEQDKQP